MATNPHQSDPALNKLNSLLPCFPDCSYAFAYGSAVFAQKDQAPGKMVDLVFIVDDPFQWHSQNLEINPSHYSALKHLGPKLISYIQENFGCGIYYNTFAEVHERVLKYGVMSTEAALDDLMNWRYAYVAGRLHKPVLVLKETTNLDLVKALRENHESALRASLLQMPQCSTKSELYYAITELSYIGDSRMIMGEHPNKVQNIVASNSAAFDEIYLPLLRNLNPLVRLTSEELILQDMSSGVRLQLLLHLPPHLQQHMAQKVHGSVFGSGMFTNYENVDNIMTEISTRPDIPTVLREALGSLVWIASVRQTMTGFLSTGLYGSIKYALEKIHPDQPSNSIQDSTTITITIFKKRNNDDKPVAP